MNRIKVAHILHSFLPVTQNWIYNQISYNRACDHDVLCQFTHNTNQFPMRNVFPAFDNLHMMSRLRLQLLRLWVRHNNSFFRKIILRNRPHVLHGHFSTESWRILDIALEMNIPLVTTFYGLDVDKLSRRRAWRYRYKELFRHGRLFIAEGNHMAERIRELGCPPERIRVVKIGVDIKRIEEAAAGACSSQSTVKILFVGLEREKKGPVDAARAFAQVARECSDAELHIVGDGRFRGQVEKILRDNGALAKTVFHGFVDVERYLELLVSCDMVLAPSCRAWDGDTEGGAPVVCIEAQAAAKPVVGTLHCDIPSIVSDKVNGLLCPEHDVERLASNLLLLVKDRELRIRMGNAGKENALENHDISRQAGRMAEIYCSIVNR